MPDVTVADRHRAVDRIIKVAGITTCTVSDVLDAMGIANSVLDVGIRRVAGASGMFHGAAYPVEWVPNRKGPQITAASPSTWTQVRDFLVPELVDGTGRVYLAGSGALIRDAALAGGLSCTYLAQQLRFEGIVLGGAVRDRDVVTGLSTPVLATGYVPVDTQGSYRVASVGGSCLVANVLVSNGDWVFADDNGVVIVPASRLSEVLAAAERIESVEQGILDRLAAGERLPDIVDSLGRI
jgi:regulator of RNase E activity RraA